MTEAVIIKKPNQWTGFYMRMASVMKGLSASLKTGAALSKHSLSQEMLDFLLLIMAGICLVVNDGRFDGLLM